MVQHWPPADPAADDGHRQPTHRMICFQTGDPAGLGSWCALYPLDAGPYTEPDVLVSLVVDEATLLDVDTGAAVSATRHLNARWEVRPLTGPGLMATRGRSISDGPGFAEARGLAPLIIPRPGRTVSPYAKAVAGSSWVPSPSLETVDRWRRRRRRAVGLDVLFIGGAVTGATVGAVLGSPQAILIGVAAVVGGVDAARRHWRNRVVTTGETSDESGKSTIGSGAALRTLVHLNWRPSSDWGAMAWVVIADDEHGHLEAPVTGMNGDLLDSFPAMAAVDGTFGSGKPVRLTLDDGTVLQTIRPLRRAV